MNINRVPEPITSPEAAVEIADLGFLHLGGDHPRSRQGATLIVALRPTPMDSHFDPEAIAYWVDDDATGSPVEIAFESSAEPTCDEFSWGEISIRDRLGKENLFFAFGGTVSLTRIDAGLGVAVFSSLAPIFREGGHSQGTDSLGPSSGAFFARLRAAFARADTAESRIARADPMAIYAAFTADLSRRMRAAPTLAAAHPDVAEFLCRERAWLASSLPDSVVAGDGLLASLSLP